MASAATVGTSTGRVERLAPVTDLTAYRRRTPGLPTGEAFSIGLSARPRDRSMVPTMPLPAVKLAPVSEPPIDINEASEGELRDALPGIGQVLAKRIVAYREEHGPFVTTNDLTRVSGINEGRISKLAPRISVAPNSGFHMRAGAHDSMGGDSLRPSHLSSVTPGVFPGSFAPSLHSLLPKGAADPLRARPFSAPPRASVPAGANLPFARPSIMPFASARASSRELEEESAVDPETYIQIPLHRPWRVWLAVGAIGLFSAVVGAVSGIRSQDGGPRGSLERRVGRVQSDMADVAGSVRALEGNASVWASSINALDARLADQERTGPKIDKVQIRTGDEKPPIGPNAHGAEQGTATKERVHQAMRELDFVLGRPAGK